MGAYLEAPRPTRKPKEGEEEAGGGRPHPSRGPKKEEEDEAKDAPDVPPTEEDSEEAEEKDLLEEAGPGTKAEPDGEGDQNPES